MRKREGVKGAPGESPRATAANRIIDEHNALLQEAA
jgi:hypothetical protein